MRIPARTFAPLALVAAAEAAGWWLQHRELRTAKGEATRWRKRAEDYRAEILASVGRRVVTGRVDHINDDDWLFEAEVTGIHHPGEVCVGSGTRLHFSHLGSAFVPPGAHDATISSCVFHPVPEAPETNPDYIGLAQSS